MECPEVARRLWEYLDDELAAKEARAIERHLAGCRACDARCRRARAFLACLARGLSRHCQAPERLRAGLHGRLDVQDPRR